MSYAVGYRRVYGTSRSDGMPVIAAEENPNDGLSSDIFISQDIMVAAPLWHDWAKPIVFQWNADGSEFKELNFGGNGMADRYGLAGDSKTGGHHILGIAEAMKRGFAPDFIITQASAHSAPTSGNEFKAVNWIRAAAILAQMDPVAQGYLYLDGETRMRLPPLRQLGSIDLVKGSLAHTNTLAEYALHNLSDADFNLTGPAVTEIQVVLDAIAPQFGFDPADMAVFNNRFRNVVLSNFSAERLLISYGNGGIAAVAAEIGKIRGKFNSTTGAGAAANSESSKREFHANVRAVGTPVSAR